MVDTIDRIVALLNQRATMRQRIRRRAIGKGASPYQDGRVDEATEVLECVEELLDDETNEAFRLFRAKGTTR